MMTESATIRTGAGGNHNAAGDVLLVDRIPPVTRLTLNREHVRNPLSEAMIAALKSAIDDATADDAIRVVIIAAKGPAFSAGHDMKEMTRRRSAPDGGRAYYTWLMEQCSAMMQAVVSCPKPVIAEVQGIAAAAGCQLVASCDLAVAARSAKFSTPGVNIGLFCSTPMVAMSRNVARKNAMEMLLTGEAIDAERAREIGLVNRVVPDERLREETMALAETIASKSAAVLAIGKEAFYRQLELDLADAYAYASDVMVTNMLHREAVEGVGAFVEKRIPEWKHR